VIFPLQDNDLANFIAENFILNNEGDSKLSESALLAQSQRVLNRCGANNPGKEKLADKPGSVPTLLWVTVIHLGARLLVRSSSLPGSSASHAIATLFGFAPDGGYRVSP
jgi:hypothetical protein